MKRALRNVLCRGLVVALAASAAAIAMAQKPQDNHYILCLKAGRCPDPAGVLVSPTLISIGLPGAVATDTWGNVYFSAPNLIYRLGVDGGLTRVAGSTKAGFAGDGGAAVNAELNFPATYPELERDPMDFLELVGALATDASGNLYIADAYNDRVRKIDLAGIITTVAGDGTREVRSSVPAINSGLWWPQGVATGPTGNLYIADPFGLRVVGQDGNVELRTGTNCGPGFRGPGVCAPQAIAIDRLDNVVVPDGYCRVRLVKADGSVTTIAGADRRLDSRGFLFTCGYSGDGGPAVDAALANGSPYGVAVAPDGGVYIADTGNSCVRKVDVAGIITTFAGICRLPGFSGDGGVATSAQLHVPRGIAVDDAGNVYIADYLNARIRKVGTDGIITTVAGNGSGIPAVIAETSTPTPATVTVVEFYNASQDHYFMTWHANEIAILDAGVQIKGWQRTGHSLLAYPMSLLHASEICRFQIFVAGQVSHFYGRGAAECAATIAAHPEFALEDPKFMAMILPIEGRCPKETTEVYRVFNNRPDANHRYMTDKTVRAQMVASGWVAEGDGPDLVSMCAPR